MKDKFEDCALELSVEDKVNDIAKEVENKVEAMTGIIKQAKKLQLQVEAALKKDSLASASQGRPHRKLRRMFQHTTYAYSP